MVTIKLTLANHVCKTVQLVPVFLYALLVLMGPILTQIVHVEMSVYQEALPIMRLGHAYCVNMTATHVRMLRFVFHAISPLIFVFLIRLL